MKEIQSPCISVCTYNEERICIGCYRSEEEISNWLFMSAEEKQQVIRNTMQRKGSDYYGNNPF
ncbi:MAG TPA: DUF1289 domain-containing protein [Bacteroidia bacterium]|nr:DUF1289 domain-containing protein [Sphingobacteriales bacterium]HPD64111.1 DUF1289 domain-containing protein [Bacteroidia bacterium]HRS57851.1 DUF1289 domain-containing protein [Bacteroidia bacterium]HRU67809.1 DUF1289 domain-containing protein [Bacteroidia bacterium]